MRTALWGLSLLLVSGIATGGDAKTDKLDGTWINEHDGKKHVMKITKDTFSITFEKDDKEQKVTGKFKIDASKKPKQMDVMVTGGSVDKFKDKTALIIYELKGDTLRWCANEPGAEERPTEFPEEQGGRGKHLYLIFKRGK